MAQIPSRKLSTTGKKIASKTFPKANRKISSGGIADPASRVSSRKPAKTSDATNQAEPEQLDRPTDKQSRQEIVAELKSRTAKTMIHTLMDACQFILEDLREPQPCSCLASQLMEMKLWRASEADVRDTLTKDINRHKEESRFVQVDDDTFALRVWSET